MGCCESRSPKNLFTDAKVFSSPLTSISRIQHESIELSLTPISSISNSKVIEIINYINFLDNEKKWCDLGEEKDTKVSKVDNSIFNSENIVSRVQIKLEISVQLHIVLQFLVSIATRKTWDSFIEDLKLIEGNEHAGVLYRKIKLLFYKAEFIEKQFVVVDSDKVYVITYSVNEDEFANVTKSKRDINVMNVFKISENEEGTEITLVNQMGYRNYLKNLAGSLGIPQQKLWLGRLKRKIHKHLLK